MTTLHGTCDPRFEPVREALAKNFSELGDVGACVAVSLEGEMVVDLWGGHRDEAKTLPWEEDTIVNVYSTTKTMAAICALVLADRGQLDFNAKVASYWPEFAQNGKDQVEVRHFMSHSAGLSGLEEPFGPPEIYDWDRVVGALARQAPWWEPGTASGYHAITQGHLIGEVVRRITGVSIGEFFAKEIAGPLGADFHIGTGEEHFDRIGELIPPATSPAAAAIGDSIAARTFRSPAIDASHSRTPEWRKAEIPAANGHGNARSVVRVQTAVANLGHAWGVDLMSKDSAQRVFEQQTSGTDLVLGAPIVFGMGYGLSNPEMPMGPNKNTAYWGGWGGSSIVVDQDARLCVSYVMNRMEADLLGDMRGFGILQGNLRKPCSLGSPLHNSRVKIRRTLSRLLVPLAVAALLLRAFVPVGMMASTVTDGWLFELCPSGLSMQSYMALLGASDTAHDHAEHTQSEADFVCGLSASFTAVAAEPASLCTTAVVQLDVISSWPTVNLARAPPRAHRTRAPPTIS